MISKPFLMAFNVIPLAFLSLVLLSQQPHAPLLAYAALACVTSCVTLPITAVQLDGRRWLTRVCRAWPLAAIPAAVGLLWWWW